MSASATKGGNKQGFSQKPATASQQPPNTRTQKTNESLKGIVINEKYYLAAIRLFLMTIRCIVITKNI